MKNITKHSFFSTWWLLLPVCYARPETQKFSQARRMAATTRGVPTWCVAFSVPENRSRNTKRQLHNESVTSFLVATRPNASTMKWAHWECLPPKAIPEDPTSVAAWNPNANSSPGQMWKANLSCCLPQWRLMTRTWVTPLPELPTWGISKVKYPGKPWLCQRQAIDWKIDLPDLCRFRTHPQLPSWSERNKPSSSSGKETRTKAALGQRRWREKKKNNEKWQYHIVMRKNSSSLGLCVFLIKNNEFLSLSLFVFFLWFPVLLVWRVFSKKRA